MERERISLKEFTADPEAREQASFWAFLSLARSMAEFFAARGETGAAVDENKVVLNLAEGKCEFGTGYAEGDALRYAPPGGAPEDARFSLAVLLFRLFVQAYPYEGPAYAAAEDKEAFYRNRPHFLFAEGENAAAFGVNDTAICYYSIYPESLQKRFYAAFELGELPSAEEWEKTFSELTEGLILCPHCGAETFDETGVCWRCRKAASPMRLRHMENGTVLGYAPLRPGYKFTDERNSFEIIARGACWGIKNNSSASWKWMKPSGRIVEVEKNQAVPVSLGVQIRMKGGFKVAVVPADGERAAD